MTPAEVSSAVAGAVRAAVAAGELAVEAPDEVPLSCVEAGVYVTPVALRLGPGAAEVVAERLTGWPGVLGVGVRGGFLTVRVEPGALAKGIVAAGHDRGRGRLPEGGGWADRPRTFENPGFSVRYAYARAAAVKRRGVDLGVRLGDPVGLADSRELELLRRLGELPGRAAQAVREREARPLRRQLELVAEAYHEVYERCPALPVGDEKPGAVHGARRTLAEATRIALGNGLHMIGEEPRERI